MSNAEDFFNLLRPVWRKLHNVAYQYASAECDCRDLVQEVLLRAWKGYSQTERPTHVGPWLFAIVRNVAIEWHRARERRVRLVPVSFSELTELSATHLTEPFAALPGLTDAAFVDYVDERIAAAVERLEPAYREVLVLSAAGGLTYREIGEVLDCPVGTVMSRMARARRAMREHLGVVARQEGWTKEARS